MSEFGLSVEALPAGGMSIRLRGDLDVEHVYVFDEELRRLETYEDVATLVVDLRELAFVDSTGMAALLAARRRAARAGRRLVLIQGGPPIRRIFRLFGLAEVFEAVSEIPAELAPPAAISGQPVG